MPWETKLIEREELYEQVWAEPVRTVAKRYGISDVALAKICKKLRVPLPGRGYWAKRAAGQKLRRARLPRAKEGQVTVHRIHRYRDPVEEAEPDDDVKHLLEREASSDMQIVVADKLDHPHPLVRKSEPLLCKAAERGKPHKSKRPCLDVHVSHAQLDRALRVMDALLKGFDARGFKVELVPAKTGTRDYYGQADDVPAKMGVHVLGEFIEFDLSEDCDRIDVTPEVKVGARGRGKTREDAILRRLRQPTPEFEYRPTGKLALRMNNVHRRGARMRWADGKTQRLEELLNDFVLGLITTADKVRLARLERERAERERQEERRRREEAERRRREHEQLAYDLNSRVSDCQQAQAIREFVAVVEADAREQHGELPADSDLAQWVAWAHNYADQLEVEAVRTVLQRQRTPPPQARTGPRLW